MNHITNYLLILISLFFGLVILNDRFSNMHLFEGMDGVANDANSGAKEVSSVKKTPLTTHPF
jgi:hypothetical protein